MLAAALVSPAFAQTAATTDDEKAKSAELARKLQNPVASLIGVPIQNNWDFGIGEANAKGAASAGASANIFFRAASETFTRTVAWLDTRHPVYSPGDFFGAFFAFGVVGAGNDSGGSCAGTLSSVRRRFNSACRSFCVAAYSG